MKKKLSLLLAIILLAVFCVSDAGAVSPNPVTGQATLSGNFQKDPPHAKNRILIQLTEAAVQTAGFQSNAAGQSDVLTGLPLLDSKMVNFNVTARKRAYGEVKNKTMGQKLGVNRWYVLEVPENSDIKTLVEEFKADKNVADASPDWIAYPAAAPNDPKYASQWGHNNTGQLKSYCWGCGGHPYGTPVGTVGFDGNVEAAWTALGSYGDSNVVIAIIDTGVDIDHPDLRLVTGYDFGDNDANPNDDSADPGHGTACSGVAAAIANNGIGTAGVAGGCSVMPLKVANSDGEMFFSSIQNALYYAADHGADVASMSLGADLTSDAATDTAIAYAYNAGVTILAATGNENATSLSYPANNLYVIGVGAANPCDGRKRSSSSSSEVSPGVNTDPNGYTCDGERWWGSNYGPSTQDANNAVDIIAPTILPTTDIGGAGGYDPSDYSMWFNGTSCATPFAAGVAGLIKSQHPTWTPSQVRQQLVLTARDVQNVESGAGWDRYSGYGMVNAGAALGGTGNLAPTANANGPYNGNQGVAISFSSAGSFDNDGTITGYAWDFGDGGYSSLANPTHTYSNAGSYSVSLTVTDDDGATGTDDTAAQVAGTCIAHPLVLTIVLDKYPAETTWALTNAAGNTLVSGGPYSTSYATITKNICLTDGNYFFTIYDAYGDGICCDYGTGSYELAEGDVVYASGGSFTTSETTPFTLTTLVNHAPTADAGGPYSGTAGQAVSFNGGASSDPDGNLLSYAWTFGDGGSATGATPSHTYAAAGSYTVTLTVDDGNGGTDDDQATATIASAPVNHAPTANVGGPYSGTAGQAVGFNGGASSDPDGDTLTYAWTFGDGGSATGATPSHTYAAAGTYTVTLTVSDGKGGSDSDQTTATIAAAVNLPPTANAGGPYGGTAGLAVAFNGSGSSDPDGDTLTYAWTFGDGGTASVATPSHTYAAAGTYTVTLTVSDGKGGTDSDQTTATIAAVGYITLAFDDFESGWGNYTKGGSDALLYTGGTYAHHGNGAADIQDNSGTASSFALTNAINVAAPGYTEIKIEFWFYAVSMDNPAEDFWVQYYNGTTWQTVATYAQGTHFNNNQFYFKTITLPKSQYTFPSNMKIRFMCDASTDGDDVYIDEIKISALGSLPVNHPPTANVGGPYSAAAGQAIIFNGSASSDPDGDTLTYAWTFGDGGTATGATPSHTYAADGTYTVTLTVSDGKGGTDSDQTTATISGVPVNRPPVANVGGPYGGTAGLAVAFNGSGSSDPDGDALTYAWTFGDGGTASVATPSHTYAAAGTYTVTLTVSDGKGGTDSDQTTATIIAAGGYITLAFDDFESGWGNYTKGGSDALMYTGGTYAHHGNGAADIQDNSGTASSFALTNAINVAAPGYTEIKIEFWFYAVSMDNPAEDFWVQYYNGTTWQTVATYAQGTHFNNNQFYFKTVTLPKSQYTFPSNMKIRFMCDASTDGDDVYIDEIKVSAK